MFCSPKKLHCDLTPLTLFSGTYISNIKDDLLFFLINSICLDYQYSHSWGGESAGNMVCVKVQERLLPDKKNVVLSKYEDKWAQPRAALLYTTCSDSYLSFWPAGLDLLQCIVHMAGRELEAKDEWGSPLPSWLKQQDSPLKLNDAMLTSESWLTSRLILSCFKTPDSQLLRNLVGRILFISLFFCCSLIYSLMGFTHKSTALDPVEEVGWKLCTLQPFLVCWWDDKVRDRQSHKGSPRALSRAALVQVKHYGFEEETQMCGSNNLQGFYSRICRALNTPPWSLIYLIPKCWYNSMEVLCDARKNMILSI